MCGHVLRAGYRTTVHSRTRGKAEPLLAKGAIWADSTMAIAGSNDVIVTMVGFPADVREVYFGEKGLLHAANPSTIFIDMTTTSPALSKDIHDRAASMRCFAVDAPVSGGDVGARQATLSVMVGGDAEPVQAVMPLLKLFGSTIVHQGPSGAGQHAKLCNQIVIAGTMVGVCEGLLYGRQAGLDLDRLLSSIGDGAASCWTLSHLAPRIRRRDFAPGFYVEHFVKDMGIILEESRRIGLTLPGLTLVHGLYETVVSLGHGRNGTHALMLALEQMSGSKGSSAARTLTGDHP